MRPVNKKVMTLALGKEGILDVPMRDEYINENIQDQYNQGWHLRYMKYITPNQVSLLFTHAEFDEVEDGDDD